MRYVIDKENVPKILSNTNYLGGNNDQDENFRFEILRGNTYNFIFMYHSLSSNWQVHLGAPYHDYFAWSEGN